MSSIGRLFDYAKIAAVDVRENYTTQALAEAIRCDVRPVVLALSHAGVLGIDASLDWRVEVTTQWSFPDTVSKAADPTEGNEDGALAAVETSSSYRYIDLVLLLATGQQKCEVWIE